MDHRKVFEVLIVHKDYKLANTLKFSLLFLKTANNYKQLLVINRIVILCQRILL
jgi:hypothetical protein